MIDYKTNFLKLCLRIESLNNHKENSFNYDEIKECERKVKEIKISIDKLLDNYLNEIKQEKPVC